MYEDGTARMDFDLPGADNDRIRALEAPINEVIARDVPLTFGYIPLAEAQAQHGLIRSRSVAPVGTATSGPKCTRKWMLAMARWSLGNRAARRTRCPLTRVPLVLPKYRSNSRPSVFTITQCILEMLL